MQRSDKRLQVSAFSPRPGQVAATFVDLTKLKQTEAALHASDGELKGARRLNHLVARLVASTELHPLLDEVLDATIELQQADFGTLQLYRPGPKMLEIVAQRGFRQEFLDHFASVDDSTSVCGRAMLTRGRVIVEDVQSDPGFEPHLQVAVSAGFRAVQSTPLFSRQGELLGMISTHFRQPHRPSERELEFTDLYVKVAEELIQRIQAEGALRTSEKRYREFFDHNLAGTFRTTPDGRILDCNDSFARMLGYSSKEEILSHSASDLYSKRSEREVAISHLLQQKVTTNEEFCLQRKDGSSMWILANRALNESEQPPTIEGTMMDITAQKRAEGEVRSLLNISRTLNPIRNIDALIDSLIVEAVQLTDAECGWSGTRTSAGMVCKRYLRDGRFIPIEYCWPPGIGWPGWVLVHKVPYVTNDAQGDRVIVPEIRERFGVRSGIDTPLLDARGEVIGFFEVNNKKDKAGFTESDVEKLVATSQVASVALQNAMAYQKIQQNEDELRQLSTRLLRLQDEERRRLGRELHDSTGQILATLMLKVGTVKRSLPADNRKALKALSECSALAKQCSDDLRTLSYLLHPPSLDEEGLASAVRCYVQGFARRSGIHVELSVPPEVGRLPQEVETSLFRIVQEGLTNVHLHSGSPRAWVKITSTPSEVALEIGDEGRGMPSQVLNRVPSDISHLGVGIAGMRERVRQLGGRLLIDSGNRGTKVRVTLPLSGGLVS